MAFSQEIIDAAARAGIKPEELQALIDRANELIKIDASKPGNIAMAEFAKQSGIVSSRPAHELQIEALNNSGDRAGAIKLTQSLPDSDPYKAAHLQLFGVGEVPIDNLNTNAAAQIYAAKHGIPQPKVLPEASSGHGAMDVFQNLKNESGMINFPARIGTENNPDVEKLIALYKKSYQQIVSEMGSVSDAGRVQRTAALQQIEKILTNLGEDTNKWLAENIPKQYQLGAAQGIAQLEDVGATRTFYHGVGGAKALTSGGNMLGNGFYVSDSKEIAQKFGSKITEYTIKLNTNEVLTINSQAELKQLYMDATRAFRGVPLQEAIPKYAMQQGYRAIEINPAFEPYGGVNILDKKLLTSSVRAVETGFTNINQSAVEALVSDAQKSFGDALSTVNRSARQIFNKATQQAIKDRLASGEIAPLDRVKIATDIKQIISDQGVAALTDRSGRQWTLDRYAEMLTRTKIVEARNTGLSNKLAENGYDLVQVSSHGAKDVCGDWEGKILSLNGRTEGYPTVDEATADGLFHPNCEHAINAVVPDLSNDTIAYDNPYNAMSPEDQAAADFAFATR